MGEKTQKQKIGKFGEDEAVQYLVKKGYKIIERNHRQKWGEIDIVTISPDWVLVFIEVKALVIFEKEGIQPEDNLTSVKLKKLQRTCHLYANSHENLINERGWQIDLVAIDVFNDHCDFRHYENI